MASNKEIVVNSTNYIKQIESNAIIQKNRNKRLFTEKTIALLCIINGKCSLNQFQMSSTISLSLHGFSRKYAIYYSFAHIEFFTSTSSSSRIVSHSVVHNITDQLAGQFRKHWNYPRYYVHMTLFIMPLILCMHAKEVSHYVNISKSFVSEISTIIHSKA